MTKQELKKECLRLRRSHWTLAKVDALRERQLRRSDEDKVQVLGCCLNQGEGADLVYMRWGISREGEVQVSAYRQYLPAPHRVAKGLTWMR